MLLTLGVGQMWAFNPVYLIGDDAGNWTSGKTNYVISNNADEGSCYFYLTKNNCFAVYITYYNEQAGPGSDKAEMGISPTGDQKFYIWGDGENTNSAKYTGNSGIVEVHAKQKDNGDDQPWIWLTRPTVYIRHNWNNAGWSNQAMTDNSDGTYKYKGQYSGSSATNVGPCSDCTEGGATFKYFTVTPVGSPLQGDYCLFEYDASGFKGFGTQAQNTGSLTITKLCGLTYNGNGRDGGTAVPSALSDQKYGSSVTLSSAAMTKTGYTLTGWNTANDGSGTHYDLGASFTFSDKNNTLYAEWTQTISIDKNTGTTAGSMTICFNAGSLKSLTAATKTDWVLDSYWTSSDESGSKVVDYNAATGEASLVSGVTNYTNGSGKWTRTAATTLYAHWKQTYTVTYDANYPAGATSTSGSVPVDAVEHEKNSTVTVASNSGSLAAGGYTFAGWNTRADGNGTNYTAGSGTFTITDFTTLYAKWTENLTEVTVSVSPSGSGTLTVGGEAFTSGNTTNVGVATKKAVVVTPYHGYRFSSWGTTGNAAQESKSGTTFNLKGNGSGSTGTLTATQIRSYAFVEGRFHITNSSRNGSWTNTFGGGDWDQSSTRIPFEYDGTNHRFYLHTYATPHELTTQISSQDPVFFVKTSSASGSLSDVISFKSSSAATLSDAGTENKVALYKHDGDNNTNNGNLKISSSTENGYTILYFDEDGIWYELEHTLTYDGNGAASGSAPASSGNYYNNGTNATAASNSYTGRTNYSFAGWNTNQYITGTNYAAGASVPMTTNTILYAKWNRTVTLEQEDATTEGSTSVVGTWNCATLPSITNPAKDGYVFGGWYTEEAGSGNIIINTSGQLQASKTNWTDASGRFQRTPSNAASEAKPLYAKWTQTVTLNANTGNHGSGSNTSATIVYKATAKSSITHCTAATGYHLVGYYTAATGGTKILEANGTFAGSDITVSEVDYIKSSKWVKAGATTLYAHYDPDTYTITLNANGGGSGSTSVTATYDSKTLASITNPTKAGYTFAGWYSGSGGTGSMVIGTDGKLQASVAGYTDASGNWTRASTATLYAKWTENMTTVTLAASPAGKGTFTIGGATVTSTTAGVATTRLVTAVAGTGYSVNTSADVWAKDNSNITLNNVRANPVTVTGAGTVSTSTLTATFTPNTYTVRFNGNGSTSGSMSNQAFTYDAAQSLTSNAFTKTGYTFAGWATSAESSVVYTDGQSVSNLRSTTGYFDLYAKWTANSYTITFDATTNGGTVSAAGTKSVTYETTTSIASCPTGIKNGYCFAGWYTAASDGELVIDANGVLQASVTDWTDAEGRWQNDDNQTVYAVYTAPVISMNPTPTLLSTTSKNDTIVLHPTYSCTPTGNYNITYAVGYQGNHTLLSPQPSIMYGTGAKVGYDSIKMPLEANIYELIAILKTGSTRGEGTEVRRDTMRYAVQDKYTVTMHYMVDGVDVATASTWLAMPKGGDSSIVKAPLTKEGYVLDHWELGIGVDTCSGRGTVGAYTEDKWMYAENNATIKLHYKSKPNTVYFFRTFDKFWYSTLMGFYDYGTTEKWTKSGEIYKGAGSDDMVSGTVSSIIIDEKYEASITASTTKFAFTYPKKDDQDNFWGTNTDNQYARVIYRNDFNAATPMFVPVTTNEDADYLVVNQANGGEAHYYRGFWVKNSPVRDSTGYYLRVYDGTDKNSAKLIQTLPLRLTKTGEGGSWELTATMDLEANRTYGFKFTKATGASTKDSYTNTGTMTSGSHTAVEFTVQDANHCGLTTTAAGDYTFHVFCKGVTKDANEATAADVQGKLAVTVDYSTLANDYRVYYADATQTEPIMSSTIHNRANGLDTVSFFVRKSSASRVMKFQKFNGSTWTDVASGTIDLSEISKDSVYVFYVAQNEGATTIEATGHDYYSGDFYIRTDCVDEHKWDYKQSLEAHKMSPSDYGMASVQPFKFSHYYPHWIDGGGSVKFVVANKYAPCISDTVITDTYANVAGGKLPSAGASVRFMYNKGTNEVQRAYLAGAEGGSYDANFLKISTVTDSMGTTAATPVVQHELTFTDEKNWIYQATIKAKPGMTAKLTAKYNGNTQYFIGNETAGRAGEAQILGGTGDAWQQFLLTYDFKQNRLICAWQPSGDSITGDVPINADVMVIREAQNDAQQILFKTNDAAAKLSGVKYIYGVMQFNRDDMVNHMWRWDYTTYSLCMYYISFPFDVAVNDIMAPGSIGKEWRLQRYNGDKRSKGWFAGDGVTTFWEDLQPGDTLHAYEGYSLLLNRRIFNDGESTVWANKKAGDKLYMYFPSMNATTGVVANKTVEVTVPSHLCTLDRVFDQDLTKPSYEQRNHKVVDSHWNMIGTPLFEDKTASTITPAAAVEEGGEPLAFIYEWNPAGNTLRVADVLDTDFEFKTMYSYMAQFAGKITFTGSAVNQAVAAKRNVEHKNYTLNLTLSKEEEFVGRAYVKLRENAVDTFLLNEDLYMLKNGVNADLYTFAGAYEASANVLTVSNHTVPVGIDVKTAGTYTFSMPDNFDGTVTLLDTYTQTRTNLSLDVYEVYLEQGTIEGRFFIELNIQGTITSLENVDGNNGINDGGVHKFIQNDQMYILKNGVIYDARGARVK